MQTQIQKRRRLLLMFLLLVVGLYSISHSIFMVQITLLHHTYRGYTGTSIFYLWYLFHSSTLSILLYLAPVSVLLVGIVAYQKRFLLIGLVAMIAAFDLILAAGPLSSYPIYTMRHRGSTRYEEHVFYLADFGEKWNVTIEKQILYQCDSLGLICSSEFSMTEDDRKEILERIQ